MATMESLQKAIEDMNTMMTKMNSTLETLAPLAPSATDLAALPGKVADLLKTMNDANNHLQSVGVAFRRLEEGESSSGSSVQPQPQTPFRVRVGRWLGPVAEPGLSRTPGRV